MAIQFDNAANQVRTTLSTAYNVGDGSMTVASTTGMPSVPFRITVGAAIYRVTAINGAVLTIGTPIENTTEVSLPSGCQVDVLFTAGHYNDHSAAIKSIADVGPYSRSPSLATYSLNPLQITLDNTVYQTTNNNSYAAISIVNPNANGQSQIQFTTNNNVVGKIRVDYAGSVTWVAGLSGSHSFLVGGDVGNSLSKTPITINNSGSINLGPNVSNVASNQNSIVPVTITYRNMDYNNSGGNNSHLVINNPLSTGQNSVCSVINGNVVAKWRTDYVGNINWVAGQTGGHAFYVGGDYGVGSSALSINNDTSTTFTPKANKGVLVKAATNHTNDLLQFTDSGNNIMSGVNSSGYIRSVVGNGTPSTSPPDGSMYVDNQNGMLYVRIGGTWKKATLS